MEYYSLKGCTGLNPIYNIGAVYSNELLSTGIILNGATPIIVAGKTVDISLIPETFEREFISEFFINLIPTTSGTGFNIGFALGDGDYTQVFGTKGGYYHFIPLSSVLAPHVLYIVDQNSASKGKVWRLSIAYIGESGSGFASAVMIAKEMINVSEVPNGFNDDSLWLTGVMGNLTRLRAESVAGWQADDVRVKLGEKIDNVRSEVLNVSSRAADAYVSR